MNLLPIELIDEILNHVLLKRYIFSSTKSMFYLQHFCQEKMIYSDSSKDCPNEIHAVHLTMFHKKLIGMVSIHTFWKAFHTSVMDFKNDVCLDTLSINHEWQTLRFYDCYIETTPKWPNNLRTLVITGKNTQIFDIILPETLEQLIIPHTFMNIYPVKLKHLDCDFFNPENADKLIHLKKLIIRTRHDDKKTIKILPKNITYLNVPSCYCHQVPDHVKIFVINNYYGQTDPLFLGKVKFLKLCNTTILFNKKHNKILSITKLSVSNEDSLLKNIEILADLTHLTINNPVAFRIETFLKKINKINFPKLTTLYFILKTVDVINIDFPLLETVKIRVEKSDFIGVAGLLNIIGMPLSLKNFYLDIGGSILVPFILPPNLVFASLTMGHFHIAYELKLPETLRYLTMSADHNLTNDGLPPTLVYLDIITQDQQLLDTIVNLSKLKYLKIKLLLRKKAIQFPKSLRCLQIDYNYMKNIPKFVKHVVFTF